jgi:hypothetical protein
LNGTQNQVSIFLQKPVNKASPDDMMREPYLRRTIGMEASDSIAAMRAGAEIWCDCDEFDFDEQD